METLHGISQGWESILSYGTRHFVPMKTTLYREGVYGEGFYYLHKGFVKTLTSMSKGNQRQLSLVVPGQTLGIQVMDRNIHVTTAVTVKDCILYYFSCELMNTIIQSHPDSLFLVTSAIIGNINVIARQINLDTLTAGQQIASVLLSAHDELQQHKIYLSQRDLVNCTGLTRITVYKTLKDWNHIGMIDIQNRKLVLLQPELLKSHFSAL
jgi:CRP-like cAMP-binding protein